MDELKKILPEELVYEIQGMHIPLNGSDDRIIWPHTANGQFSLKSIYHMLSQRKTTFLLGLGIESGILNFSLELCFLCGLLHKIVLQLPPD